MPKIQFLIISIFSLISYSVLASPLDLNCENSLKEISIQSFSKDYLNADYEKLPFFLKSWLDNDIDKNKDLLIDSTESSIASCFLSAHLKTLVLNTSDEYVSKEGTIEPYAYWANDNKVSSYEEFRLALGGVALQWLPKFISELQLENSQDILQTIQSGLYTVSTKNIEEQWDLSSTDQNPISISLKALDLAYELSRLSTELPVESWKPTFNALLKEFLSIKNFPYVVSITEKNNKPFLDTFINRYGLGGVGIEGVNRYYIMEKLGLQFEILGANQYSKIWGQYKNQSWFLLRDPATMNIDSKKFVNRISQQMKNICETEALPKLSWADLDSTENLQKWMSQYYTIFAESFWKETPTVLVSQETLEGGSNAYVTEDQQVYFSFPNIMFLKQQLALHFSDEESLQQLERNLIFILVQEWTHLLQNETELYEPNLLFYNNPANAYMALGRIGVDWYENQPLEKDAKAVAKEFVSSLSSCQNQ